MELDLCSGCRRHVHATATTCPFCGAARASSAPEPADRSVGGPAHPHHHRSRAQRYVLSAAVAAGIGIAKASASASPDAGNESMAVAVDPTASPTSEPAQEDAGAQLPPERQDERWREEFRHPGGGPCTQAGCCGGPIICPPYGCVFPDEVPDPNEVLDIERV